MFKKLFSSLTSSSLSPGTMKARQYGILALAGVGLLGAIGLGMGGFYSISLTPSAEDFLKEKLPLKTPPEAVNPRDIWTNRVEKAAEKAGAESKTVREENIFLRKRMDEMEKAIHESSENVKQTLAKISTMIAQERQSKPALPSTGITSPSSFSPQELSPTDLKGEDRLLTGSEDITPISPSLHLTISDKRKIPFKNIDTYVPGGTYARAVLVSGVVSSTSVHKSSEPNPVILRLVDDGHLPQGFKGTMNNNVIIAACHGELSSERVHCRIERMSWVEPDGTTVEKRVEGWVVGEDGRPGLRGEVVDRSTEAIKDTFIAGLLSGMSNFLKFEATTPSFTPSLTERGSSLQAGNAAKAAASSGVGSALDKLVDFSIKRAEQLQPVIQIASGRVVDIVFKEGIDTRPDVLEPLRLAGHQTKHSNGEEPVYDKP